MTIKAFVISLKILYPMIKYQNALDTSGNRIHISTLTKDTRDPNGYSCMGCGAPMIARLGEQNANHFAHKSDKLGQSCSSETYLHKLGKLVFKEEYEKALFNEEPFYISFDVLHECNHFESSLGLKCALGWRRVKYDLTKYFKIIKEEVVDGQFVPDLLLTGEKSGAKVYIEIFVKHESTSKKLTSGTRIIEIKLREELDIEKIKTCSLPFNDEVDSVKFYNFSPDNVVSDLCQVECQKHSHFSLFILYKSGKSRLDFLHPSKIADKLGKYGASIDYYNYFDEDPAYRASHYFNSLVILAHKGLNVRSCFICKHSGDNTSTEDSSPIYCKELGKTCGSNDAATCAYFMKNDSFVRSAYQNLEFSRPSFFKHFADLYKDDEEKRRVGIDIRSLDSDIF